MNITCPKCSRLLNPINTVHSLALGLDYCSRHCLESSVHVEMDGPACLNETEPRRKAFSQDELIREAIKWTKTRYQGDERYHILGLLVDFVTDVVPKEEETK